MDARRHGFHRFVEDMFCGTRIPLRCGMSRNVGFLHIFAMCWDVIVSVLLGKLYVVLLFLIPYDCKKQMAFSNIGSCHFVPESLDDLHLEVL